MKTKKPVYTLLVYMYNRKGHGKRFPTYKIETSNENELERFYKALLQTPDSGAVLFEKMIFRKKDFFKAEII